jgi:hypothetical protein
MRAKLGDKLTNTTGTDVRRPRSVPKDDA